MEGRGRLVLVALAMVTAALQVNAQLQADEEGLLVVYGALAPSREGDVDHQERVFFSVPADLKDRFYVRVFDPETSGFNDFTYGGTGNSTTLFRVVGGEGAFSGADLPVPKVDGERAQKLTTTSLEASPGVLIEERAFGNDPATDQRWVTLTALRTRQGEIIGDRAYFRIDVFGTGGDDGNGFSLDVSRSRDRSQKPDELEMFAYQPTVRWRQGMPSTRVRFLDTGSSPYTVQSFDAANGPLTLVTDYADLPLRASGQDFWTTDTVQTEESTIALSLDGGFETPNDVTLAVFDNTGKPIRLEMPPRSAPDPARPEAIGMARALADCQSVAFDGIGSRGRGELSYLWEFGDGSQSDFPVVVHHYALPGQYQARLRILEESHQPGRGAVVEVPVHVRNAPIADPGPDAIVAPGQQLAFDASASKASDYPIARYHWTFGDGATASGRSVQKAFEAPGLYRTILRVEDESAHPCNFGVATRLVSVNFPPVAEAGVDQMAVVGEMVWFDGSASYDVDGANLTYQWDMADGTNLVGSRAKHEFQQPGVYNVLLTVTDDSGVSNNQSSDRIRVIVNAPPRPHFTVPDRPISVSEVTTLDARETSDVDGEILAYQWDFGDGAFAEGPVVNYAWTEPGAYDVTLTVLDDSGTASAQQRVIQKIIVDAAPTAEAGPDQFVSASEVHFDGSASSDAEGEITSYTWDFGDGTSGGGAQVIHAYAQPGVYEVALVVRDNSGAPLNSHRDKMLVTINANPIADAGPSITVAPGEEFVLSGRASVDPDGSISNYVWRFPSGLEKTGQRVAHSISEPGLHRVGLTVFDDFQGGAASDEGEVFVTVNAPPIVVAGNDLLVAPGETVTFDAGLSFDPDGQLVGYRWEFDDLGEVLAAKTVERAYVTPGLWSVQLFVTDDSGVANSTAKDEMTVRVNRPPVAEAGPPVQTEQLHVRLSGKGSSDGDGDTLIYRWDFGDGSDPAYGQEVQHVFPRAGVFPVTLHVDDGTGLSNASAVDVTTVTIKARPLADAGGNRNVCSGEPILFDGSDSIDPDGGLLRYSWDFGDGSISDLVNPTKTYEQPGVYQVTLLTRNETAGPAGMDKDRIAVVVQEGPIADAGGDLLVCTNSKVRFDGSGSTDADGAVNAFNWTFGDGGTASGEAPEYVFKEPGNYTVTLSIAGEARGSCKAFDTDTAQVTVIEAPRLDVLAPDVVAVGHPTRFTAQLSEAGEATPLQFGWDFGNGELFTGSEVEHAFDMPGTYLVTLSAELAGGRAECDTLRIQKKVIVNAAPEPQIEGPDHLAVGEMVTFEAHGSSDSDGEITAFDWFFGDGSKASGVRVTHRFSEPGTYKVRLVTTDNAGVSNSAVETSRLVRVNSAPVADLQNPSPICPGADVQWSVDVAEGTQVEWRLAEGKTTVAPRVTHQFAKPGLYPIRVSMDDGGGLANSIQVEEIYVRVNAPPTALAGPDRTICPGDTVVFDGGSSGDIDGLIARWIWQFDDGIVLEGQRVERSFPTAGDVSATLKVMDDSGATGCDFGEDTVRILVNSPPSVDAGPDQTIVVGGAHDMTRFDATSARDPDGHGVRVSWSFGDGGESSGLVARHKYGAPGRYQVQVTARDTTGLVCGTGTDMATITAVARE